MIAQAQAVLTDLAEWERGVVFPLVVVLIAGVVGYTARCATRILAEFQETRREVQRITHALRRAGILDDDE